MLVWNFCFREAQHVQVWCLELPQLQWNLKRSNQTENNDMKYRDWQMPLVHCAQKKVYICGQNIFLILTGVHMRNIACHDLSHNTFYTCTPSLMSPLYQWRTIDSSDSIFKIVFIFKLPRSLSSAFLACLHFCFLPVFFTHSSLPFSLLQFPVLCSFSLCLLSCIFFPLYFPLQLSACT